MTGYLVDTNVISAGAPGRREHTAAILAWMDAHSADLFLSVVTIAELHAGVARLNREGATRRASALTAWLDTVEHLYRQRILPIGFEVAVIAGELSDVARGQGAAPGFADAAIAATARAHLLVVLTRNLRHFRPFGVEAVDPFQAGFAR